MLVLVVACSVGFFLACNLERWQVFGPSFAVFAACGDVDGNFVAEVTLDRIILNLFAISVETRLHLGLPFGGERDVLHEAVREFAVENDFEDAADLICDLVMHLKDNPMDAG